MTERLARFSFTFDGDPDGNQDLVLNASASRGFTVTGVQASWQSEDMTGSSDLPVMGVSAFTGTASGGTAGFGIFSHTPDAPATTALVNPTALGTNEKPGPQIWPGEAHLVSGSWYLLGGWTFDDFGGSPIYVAPGNSLRVRQTKFIQATVYFSEHLVA